VWPVIGAVGDVALVGLTVWLARRTFGGLALSNRSDESKPGEAS
jgi:hypothetical protein